MKLHELRAAPGARKPRKRVGRGYGSGHGTTATRGSKGQQSRAGGKFKPGFEGGSRALIKRLPYKRGFTNPFRVEYEAVNVRDLSRFEAGTDVDLAAFKAVGLVRTNKPVKVLADGEISIAVNVTAHRFSAAARTKIEAAGGRVTELSPRPVAEQKAEA